MMNPIRHNHWSMNTNKKRWRRKSAIFDDTMTQAQATKYTCDGGQ